MLHVEPKNDFEVGFNSALIKLLKIQTNPTETVEENKLKTAFNMLTVDKVILLDKYNVLSSLQKQTIFESIKDGQKLMSIKQLKEYADMGLKEAKDVIDLYLMLVKC